MMKRGEALKKGGETFITKLFNVSFVKNLLLKKKCQGIVNKNTRPKKTLCAQKLQVFFILC